MPRGRSLVGALLVVVVAPVLVIAARAGGAVVLYADRVALRTDADTK